MSFAYCIATPSDRRSLALYVLVIGLASLETRNAKIFSSRVSFSESVGLVAPPTVHERPPTAQIGIWIGLGRISERRILRPDQQQPNSPVN